MLGDYRITPVTANGVACDGVAVDEDGAWLGKVVTGPNGEGTVVTEVVRVADSAGDWIPAPADWRQLVLERLP